MAFAAATRGAACGGGVQNIEKVGILIFERREQGFDIVIENAGLVAGHDRIAFKLGRNDHFLATFYHIGTGAIGKIQLYSATVRGHERFTLVKGVANVNLADIARCVHDPGVARDGNDRCYCHEVDPR
ncbi:hypothetical protein [Vreelandella sp. TE19]